MSAYTRAMGDRDMPLAIRLVMGLLVFLTAWQVLAVIMARDEGVKIISFVVLAGVSASAAWCLLKRIAWGYLLGLLVSFYWLYVGVLMLPTVGPQNDISFTIGAIVYFTFGGLLLVGLLTPSSRRWFATIWRSAGSS